MESIGMSGGKRSSYPSRQRRAGPAPLASFEDLSDAVESPESPKETDNDNFPMCIMDNQVGPDEEDSGAASHEDATPSTPRVLVETPSTPLSVDGSLCGSLATTPTPERTDNEKGWSWARRSPLSPLTSPLFSQKKNRKSDTNGDGADRKAKGEEDEPGKGCRSGAGTPSPRSVRKLFTMTLFKPRDHQDVRSPTSPIPSPKSPRKSTAATLSGLFKFGSGTNKEDSSQNAVVSPSKKKGPHNIVTFFKGAKENVGEQRSNVAAHNYQHAKTVTSSGGGSVLATFFHRKTEQKGDDVAVTKGGGAEDVVDAKAPEAEGFLHGKVGEVCDERPVEPSQTDADVPQDALETTLSPVLEERLAMDAVTLPLEEKGSPESESDLEVQPMTGKGDEAEAETLLAEDSPDNEDLGLDVTDGDEPPRFAPSPPLLQSARLQRIEDAKTIPIERPRCTAPLSVASLEAYINTVAPITFTHSESESIESHSSAASSTVTQEGLAATKLKVVLPAEEFGAKCGKPRTPKKAAFRSWYEFCEVGLQSPRSRRKESQRSASGDEVTSIGSAWSFSQDTAQMSRAWIAFEAVDKGTGADAIDWGASGSSWATGDPLTPDDAFQSPTECEYPNTFNM